MPITAVAELQPLEGEDPRDGYERVTRALNGGQPMTNRCDSDRGQLRREHGSPARRSHFGRAEADGAARRRGLAKEREISSDV